MVQGAYSAHCFRATLQPHVFFSDLFMMTVVVPLSAFLGFMGEFFFNSFNSLWTKPKVLGVGFVPRPKWHWLLKSPPWFIWTGIVGN